MEKWSLSLDLPPLPHPGTGVGVPLERPAALRASACVCTTALNSFRDTKETAIETTTQFIGQPQLDGIDSGATAAGIPMT